MATEWKRKWIKLHVEMLDDEKVGILSDTVQLHYIKLLLIAGLRDDDDGLLPPNEKIAYRLHIPIEQAEEELEILAEAGLLEESHLICQGTGDYMIHKFAERQKKTMTSYERVKLYRERHKDSPNDNESDNGDDNETLSLDNGKDNENTLNLNLNSISSSCSDSIFTSHFRSFNGDREQKRWRVLVEAAGPERAEKIAAWAEKKEIHMTNRGRLMDSLESASNNPNWNNSKGSKPAIRGGKQVEDKVAGFLGRQP
jgi:hypothetical protein